MKKYRCQEWCFKIFGRRQYTFKRQENVYLSTQRGLKIRQFGRMDPRNKSGSSASIFLYCSSAIVSLIGGIYAAVPLYRIFCQQTGYSGTPKQNAGAELSEIRSLPGAMPIQISFHAEVSKNLPWTFVPQQKKMTLLPGQTALAFYTAKNLGDAEIKGVATYTVIPSRAAQYFNKVQCFCFEEQVLGPGEEVDMPVFFYLDPEFSLDTTLDSVQEVALGYSFFEVREQ